MKRFFNKIVLFIATLFTNVDEWINEHVQPSIELTQKLINILESPVANLITALIPGDADDKLKDFVLVYLHKAIDALKITADISNDTNWTSKVYKMLEYVKTLSPELRKGFWQGLTRQMALASAGYPTDVKGKSINLLIEMQLSKLASGLTAEDLPNETLINGELQTVPVEPVVTAPVAPAVIASVEHVVTAPLAPVVSIAPVEPVVNAAAVEPAVIAPVEPVVNAAAVEPAVIAPVAPVVTAPSY